MMKFKLQNINGHYTLVATEDFMIELLNSLVFRDIKALEAFRGEFERQKRNREHCEAARPFKN